MATVAPTNAALEREREIIEDTGRRMSRLVVKRNRLSQEIEVVASQAARQIVLERHEHEIQDVKWKLQEMFDNKWCTSDGSDRP